MVSLSILLSLYSKKNGMTLDHKEFDAEMQAQKERARNAAATEATDWVTVGDGEPEFVGYDHTSVETGILRYRKVKQKKGEYYQIVLARTPFYAEMGGQTGDRGTLTDADGRVTEIYDTKRENGMAVHLAKYFRQIRPQCLRPPSTPMRVRPHRATTQPPTCYTMLSVQCLASMWNSVDHT